MIAVTTPAGNALDERLLALQALAHVERDDRALDRRGDVRGVAERRGGALGLDARERDRLRDLERDQARDLVPALREGVGDARRGSRSARPVVDRGARGARGDGGLDGALDLGRARRAPTLPSTRPSQDGERCSVAGPFGGLAGGLSAPSEVFHRWRASFTLGFHSLGVASQPAPDVMTVWYVGSRTA